MYALFLCSCADFRGSKQQNCCLSKTIISLLQDFKVALRQMTGKGMCENSDVSSQLDCVSVYFSVSIMLVAALLKDIRYLDPDDGSSKTLHY